MPDSLRLFIAISPDLATARALLELARALRLPEHRLTPTPQVHLTVRFLGDTAPSRLDALGADLGRIAREVEPFTLRVEGLVTLPRMRARLLAGATDLPRGLASLLERAALLPGAPARGGDPTPHLTLARFARGVRVRPINERIEALSFEAREVHLVRSDLGPAGATHETVRIAPLGAAGHQ